MILKKIFDYISGLTSNSSPDYVLGIKGNGTVKTPITSLGAIKLIGSKTLNMNVTTDQTITLSGGTKFVITDYLITNPSVSLTTAASFQLNDAINRGGNTIFYPSDFSGAEFLSNLTDNTKSLSFYDNFLVTIAKFANILNNIPDARIVVGNTIYGSITTPQGVAATADIYIYGYVLA